MRSWDISFIKFAFFTRYQGRLILANRLAWELHHKKKLPSKFTLVLHSCKSSKCVNPEHLFTGTGRHVESRKSAPKDFWNRVDKNGPILVKKLGKCWLWTGGKFNHGGGYGQTTYKTKHWPSHRLAWFLTHGILSDEIKVCHKCDNPPCVRPSHLFLGTPQDNTTDMVSKGRWKGSPKRFTAKEIKEVRKIYIQGNITITALCKKFSASYPTIRKALGY